MSGRDIQYTGKFYGDGSFFYFCGGFMEMVMLNDGNIKSLIRERAIELGFEACGFARAGEVEADAVLQYDRWIGHGKHDCMLYAERYREQRNDVRLFCPGAKTVICLALNYKPAVLQAKGAAQISQYAYGRDYHLVMREKLERLAEFIGEKWGASSRVCVDTAPIMEKYWARKAGIGFVGRNNLLILPGKGSYFFLGELVTSLDVEPDEECKDGCVGCDECVRRCPGGALADRDSLDARRCLSCQLIERRDELPEWVTGVIGDRLYGCDECQVCCPHNRDAVPTVVEDFAPSSDVLSLSLDDVLEMTPERFASLFKKSAIKRVKLVNLQRNAQCVADGRKR